MAEATGASREERVSAIQFVSLRCGEKSLKASRITPLGGPDRRAEPPRSSTLQGSVILENHDPWPLQATDFQLGFAVVSGDGLLGLRRQRALSVQKDVIHLTGGTTLALKKMCSLSGSPLDVGNTLRGQGMSEILNIRSTSPKTG